MKPTHVALTSICLITFAANADAAQIILGNLPQANDAFSASIDAGTDGTGSNFINIHWAVSFTMPDEEYEVDHVALRLREYNSTMGDIPAVGFYNDNGGNHPGALIGALLVNPPSSSDNLAQFNFIPLTPLTLVAETKYWLVVDALAGEFQWQGSFPPITPTSQIGASFENEFLFHGSIREELPSDRFTNFEIVTDIPEPSVIMLVWTAVAVCFVMSKNCGRQVLGLCLKREHQFRKLAPPL